MLIRSPRPRPPRLQPPPVAHTRSPISRRSKLAVAASGRPPTDAKPPPGSGAFGCGGGGQRTTQPTRALRTTPPTPTPPLVRVLAVLEKDDPSPVAGGTATWSDVLSHEGTRLTWFESGLALTVIVANAATPASFDAAVSGVDAVIVVDAPDGGVAASLLTRPAAAAVTTLAPLGACGPKVASLARFAGAPAFPATLLERAAAALPFTCTAAASRALTVATAMWSRGHGDDVLSAILVVVDTGVVKLKSVDAFRGRGAATLLCMLRHCREVTIACVTDPDCKAGLDCLSAVPPGDQVAAYRCIVSHESAKFEAFSLCVLTKHRCLGVDAAIPTMPAPEPQATWRGAPLDARTGLQIFVGWLAEGDAVSWKVVAGLSPAFDCFPNQVSCGWRKGMKRGLGGGAEQQKRRTLKTLNVDFFQHPFPPFFPPSFPPVSPPPHTPQLQLFYHGAARGSFWYDPVFQVDTLAGAKVWRRRHYRVRAAGDGSVAVYNLSVLDSGVVSSERWRIVDAPDDLSYALFCYVGAAAASGQAYVGAVLCTRDGGWVPERHADRLSASLARASIEPWELIRVKVSPDLEAESAPPLGLARRDAAADPVRGGGGRAVK